jgi:hypothetical protein
MIDGVAGNKLLPWPIFPLTNGGNLRRDGRALDASHFIGVPRSE